jgi:hypothetical protein
MPRTAADVEQTKRMRLFMLDDQEKEACSHERAKCVCFILMAWFIGCTSWKMWPYFTQPEMWPTTLYVLSCIVHGVGYVAAAFGGLLLLAFVLSGGKVLKPGPFCD